MRSKLKIFFLVLTIITLRSLVFASEETHQHEKENTEIKKHDEGHGDHDEEEGHEGGGKAIGEGKAITFVDEKKGFKLSAEAINTLGIKLRQITTDQITISKKTLVSSKSERGVYRYRNNFFKLVTVKILKEINGDYLISTKDIVKGDQIAIKGIGPLKITDIFSTDKSEYSHGH